ncbi:FAD dependent oxidoreductase [Trametes coccinea BRFM310]|uniref:FAD dependent oxidoreductase n=1 Tax=Trametes coccinea (strain BRFM310) TaxID=1353009 RepID=A0A1Y2IX62_TRAC3|nr:FAD dependent oxidoreductase [Trametes coccinea BRFM310]
MGSIVSKAQIVFQAFEQLRKTYHLFHKRLQESPGLPVPNPTQPLWTYPPAHIPTDSDAALPEYADIVVIGSGITGTSVVYNILSRETGLKIVMLEAREVCSGATGRNGGHINPPLYHDYSELKEDYGERIAKIMIAFRRAHLFEVQRIAEEEGILKESQVRETEHLDVFQCPQTFAESKARLEEWRAAMPVESSTFVAYDGDEAIKKFHLSDKVVGCIANAGGAMHPYRFVTSLLSILLDRHSDALQLFTNTPCTSVSSDGTQYTVATPRGTLRAHHVVHATNGWCSHLLPAFRAKIAPARGAMSAQRPGRAVHRSTLAGGRSFVFYRGTVGYDYLTQLPTGEHELMFGGGWAQACDDGLPEIGIADDAAVNHTSQSYLAGALPQYFGLENWGAEAAVADDIDGARPRWSAGRTKAQWSGVLGISADLVPWVGRLPDTLAGRSAPKVQGYRDDVSEKAKVTRLADPGEWISAGYSGEGMVHAWMSGKALAHMILDREDEIQEWFPDVLRVTEKRWKEAQFDDLISKFM